VNFPSKLEFKFSWHSWN